jgi:hypothetical protein
VSSPRKRASRRVRREFADVQVFDAQAEHGIGALPARRRTQRHVLEAQRAAEEGNGHGVG